jgi:predicted ATPase
LTLAAKTGEHWTDPLQHRIRGEILSKRDPANTGPTEEAFLTAIAIVQRQKARSFELRAALSLAKLYQSTNRAADAHVVLAPTLERFASTPEFPDVAEGKRRLIRTHRTTLCQCRLLALRVIRDLSSIWSLAGKRWGNRPASLWIAEDFGCCASG